MELIARRMEASRGLMVVLLASLVANAFLIGFIVERALYPAPQPSGGLLRVESRSIIDRLPAEHQQRIRAELQETGRQLRPHWARLRQLRGEINALAASPDPDVAAIKQKLAEIRSVTRDVQEQVQDQLFDSVLQLPHDARRTLAAADRK